MPCMHTYLCLRSHICIHVYVHQCMHLYIFVYMYSCKLILYIFSYSLKGSLHYPMICDWLFDMETPLEVILTINNYFSNNSNLHRSLSEFFSIRITSLRLVNRTQIQCLPFRSGESGNSDIYKDHVFIQSH